MASDRTPEPFAGLIREHERIAEVVAVAREATEAAAQYPDDTSLVPQMLDRLRALEAFMARELALHIAKEEQVLFPAYRSLSGDDRLIDELVVQHDRVRERRALLARALAALDHDHTEVRAAQAQLRDRLAGTADGVSPEVVAQLLDGVRQLDWIFQGHFGDEEDDLFAPGEALFSAEALAEMTEAMRALDTGRD